MANETTQLSLATRFTNTVVSAYADVAKGVVVTEQQRGLIANYFIEIDKMLKSSKQGYTWQMVDMIDLAKSVASLARLGVDISIPHSVSFMPFRNGKTGKLNLVPCPGKGGKEFIAKKYGLYPLKHGTVELVFSNDEFIVNKKDANHDGDSYEFKIKSPFNRGKCVGGFGYLEYEDSSMNKLIVMSIDEIMAHKPKNADPAFWGGNNLNAMIEKTVAKKTYGTVTLDPDKVNAVKDSFDYLQAEEIKGASLEARETIQEHNSNGPMIDFVDADYEEVSEPVEKSVEVVEDENEVVEPEDDILNMNEQYRMEV